MMSRTSKSMFYKVAGPIMMLNGFFYKYLKSPSNGGVARVHLGPGQNNYIPKWINLDANMFTAKCDVWVNLNNPLPFYDSTIDAVYSHHVVEHLPNLSHHFRDVFRCLKPGGVYRVGGPHGDNAIRKFMEGDLSWFGDWPDKRKSIGGRLENFLFCRGEHLTILTESFLSELLSDVGFTKIRVCMVTIQTFYPDHFSDCLKYEKESSIENPHTLIIEAEKPPLK